MLKTRISQFIKNWSQVFSLSEVFKILIFWLCFFIFLSSISFFYCKNYYLKKVIFTSHVIKSLLQREFDEMFITMAHAQEERGKEFFTSKNPLVSSSKQTYRDVLLFKPPTVSPKTGALILPMELEVLDPHGKGIGKIVQYLDLGKLSHKIRSSHLNPAVSFLLLDENLTAILQSDQNILDHQSFYYKEKFQHRLNSSSFKGDVDLLCLKNKVHYLHYQKIPKTPYTLHSR